MHRNLHSILYLIAAMAALALLPSGAFAQGTTQTGQQALSFCEGMLPGSTGGATTSSVMAFVKPLAQCFTDATQGIIPAMTNGFLSTTQQYYIPIVGLMFTMAVIFFGYRLVIGDVEHVGPSAFTFLFKVGGIFYFMYNAQTIYTDLMTIVQWMAGMVSTAAVSAAGQLNGNGGGCVSSANITAATDSADAIAGLWGLWDCVFGALFGFSGTSVMWGIGGYLFLLAMSKGAGILAGTVALYFLLMLFFSLVRFIHIYLISLLGMSFVFCLGYLFVPLLFFKNTFGYFQRWLTLLISLMLTPVIVIAFMGMMLVALDIALFTGQYSIWTSVAGNNGGGGGGGAQTDVFGQALGLQGNGNSQSMAPLQVTNQNAILDDFKTWLYLNWGNNTSGNNTNGDNTTVTNACVDTATQQATGGGTQAAGPMANAGLFGKTYVKSAGIQGTQYAGAPPATAAPVGTDQKALALACGAQGGTYVTAVLTSFVGAALLVYVMYSLLGYIPKLAADISSQGGYLGIAGLVADTQVFGATTVKDFLGGARDYASKVVDKNGGQNAVSNFLRQASAGLAVRHSGEQ